jgi:hypothetical protein
MTTTSKRKKRKASSRAKDRSKRTVFANSKKRPSLDEVLDAAEQLDGDAQHELIAILRRRMAERGRMRVIADVKQARREFAEGKGEVKTPAEIVREAMS